mgnify:CR=1 FL=1
MAKLIEITGKAFSGEWGTDDETGDGIPVLRTTNFTNEGVVDYRNVVTRTITKKKIEEKYLRKGDIIIEKSGGSDKQPVGRVVFFDGPEQTYLFNNFTGLLRVKDQTTWYPRYVFYSMYSNYRRGGTRAFENKTTGLHNLKTDDYVSRYEVSETSMENQMEICERLDRLYGIIKMRQQELQKLDELIKARFVEMFGNPLDGTAKYPIHQVGEVANSVDPQPSHRTPPVEEGGIPYVSIKDCDYKTGKIDFEGARKVSPKVLEEHMNRYTLHDGDFVIGKIGTIGNPVFVPARNDYTLSANVVLVQPNSELVSPYFLKYSFESDFVERQFAEAKNSTSQAAFGIQKVRTVEVMNPNLDVQREFETFVKQVDKSKVAVQAALEETQLMFDSLMQEYFG